MKGKTFTKLLNRLTKTLNFNVSNLLLSELSGLSGGGMAE